MTTGRESDHDSYNERDDAGKDSDLLYNLESEEDETSNSESEDDNLYSLHEDGEEDVDEDNSEDEEDDDENENEPKGNPSVLLLKILSTPVEGWKELKRRAYTPEEISSGCFLPLIAIASISEFATKMYGVSITLSQCLMNALSTFVAFFFGYFTVLLVGGYILPKVVRGNLKQDFGKEFVMMNISTLALFYTAYKLCPMIDAVLVFLPIWTIYLIYKGVRFLRVPVAVEARSKVIMAFLIVASPVLWGWLMELFF